MCLRKRILSSARGGAFLHAGFAFQATVLLNFAPSQFVAAHCVRRLLTHVKMQSRSWKYHERNVPALYHNGPVSRAILMPS